MFGVKTKQNDTPSQPGTLSAVVLCYNKMEEVKRFSASLLKQTRKPDQVIVVDDCSTDAPASYYRDIFRSWPLVRLPKNGGQGHARNVGASFAKGEFLIFLDGDIDMRPDMLEKLENALKSDPSTSIAYSHYDRIGTRTDHVRSMPWNAQRLREINFVTMMSMVRRVHLPNPPFDESLQRYEDWDLWLTMSEAGRKGVMVPEILFGAYYKASDLSGTGESGSWYTMVRKKHNLGG